MTSKEFDKARKALGGILRDAREKAGLKQQDVADRADMHVNYYARIERGQENPSFEKLQGIMRVLSIKNIKLL